MPTFICPKCGAQARYLHKPQGGLSIPYDKEVAASCVELRARLASSGNISDPSCLVLIKEAARLRKLRRR